MNLSKKDQTVVATFADHEVIVPPNKLRKAIKKAGVSLPDDDPVKHAEEALAMLSSEFAAWMNAECERLDRARRELQAKGVSAELLEPLFHAAHDIKGEAETFGYALAAPAADSLCRVIEHSPDSSRIPSTLIDQHVDAIRAIIREYARPDVDKIAAALTKRLRDVTEDFLIRENRHRPDYLETIMSPPLQPGEAGF